MAKKRWVFKTGPHGSRVTAEERTFGGAVRLKTYSAARSAYVSRSLRFCVRDTQGKLIDGAVERAKGAAADLVNSRLKQESMPQRPTTLGQLVGRFREDRVSSMNERHAAGVERDLVLLERVIGKATIVATIDETTWSRLARLRASGEIDAQGVTVPLKQRKPVRARTVQVTLKTLGMVTRWGARVKRRGSTRPLLDSDPCSAMKAPTEQNPRRAMLTDDEFEAMVKTARERREARRLEAAERTRQGKGPGPREVVVEYMPLLLILAAETGRRIGAITRLKVSDLRWSEGSYGEITWRDENDKMGVRWIAPMTPRLNSERRCSCASAA